MSNWDIGTSWGSSTWTRAISWGQVNRILQSCGHIGSIRVMPDVNTWILEPDCQRLNGEIMQVAVDTQHFYKRMWLENQERRVWFGLIRQHEGSHSQLRFCRPQINRFLLSATFSIFTDSLSVDLCSTDRLVVVVMLFNHWNLHPKDCFSVPPNTVR
jgi:hypothetical protein